MGHAGDVALFDRFARLYHACMPAADAGVLGEGLALADREVDRVLDVGGGTGRAARAIDVPRSVVVDAAAGMLAEARREGFEAVQADAARLPVRDSSVDAVVIVDALHHMADHEAVLGEARRVLRAGGVLVIREFDRATIRGRALVAAEHLVGFDSRFFTPDELASAVATAGFQARVPDRGFGYTVVGVVGVR